LAQFHDLINAIIVYLYDYILIDDITYIYILYLANTKQFANCGDQ